MRADKWKTLFREKGWIQDGKVCIPPKFRVSIYFRDRLKEDWVVELTDVVEVGDEFLVSESTYHDGSRSRHYRLWEDIVDVGAMTTR